MKFHVDRLSQIKALVVGDVMLDRYIWGDVDRISPEAPVPVVTVGKENHVLGGAGNVAANMAGLGIQVCLVGICGHDESGKIFQNLCQNNGIMPRLIIDQDYPTTVKTRIMARKQQLFRLDREKIQPPSHTLAQKIIAQVQKAMASVDVVILSDYAKGMFLCEQLCRDIILTARECKVPCFVDPKGKNWERYTGASFITPNTMELAAVSQLPMEKDNDTLIASITDVRDQYDIQCLLLTRGEKGMCIADKASAPLFISTAAQEVYDVSGAGDTVISTFAASIAMGMSPDDAAGVANIAAGVVVGKVGTQPICISELISALEQ
ncbi:D-alpha,beta-D-heptose 7-phosphate 1-kinase [Desulfocicer vacuolatum DSM 3385]|uniref:D-alpha,beta-D-heptose 7-phosphate 1-kinase n=1 Tax=Desulfocicer vacuolatum DSM 3385 TaxID=1121400 RepID=A0A1W1Z8T4_9BACT|nr:D-glycero-beta-D-manno-heptose-7-phosphate kinase [Desulfocicer vacuolatum]SMC44732.1 D-alpha,beta-D-heptose 7-phosphate 1-kinase [Desulfocicer vacuolatum DSM 3385]